MNQINSRHRPGLVSRPACGARVCALAPVLAMVVLAAGCQPPAQPPEGAPAADAADRPQRLSTATIRVGETPLLVEVADSNETRQKGMMFRPKLGPDEAMLFVFPREDMLAFWMKNTLADLDLAYIAADGRITEIEHMTALNLDSVYTREPTKCALETPSGWFEAHGIRVGAKVTIPPDVVAKE